MLLESKESEAKRKDLEKKLTYIRNRKGKSFLNPLETDVEELILKWGEDPPRSNDRTEAEQAIVEVAQAMLVKGKCLDFGFTHWWARLTRIFGWKKVWAYTTTKKTVWSNYFIHPDLTVEYINSKKTQVSPHFFDNLIEKRHYFKEDDDGKKDLKKFLSENGPCKSKHAPIESFPSTLSMPSSSSSSSTCSHPMYTIRDESIVQDSALATTPSTSSIQLSMQREAKKRNIASTFLNSVKKKKTNSTSQPVQEPSFSSTWTSSSRSSNSSDNSSSPTLSPIDKDYDLNSTNTTIDSISSSSSSSSSSRINVISPIVSTCNLNCSSNSTDSNGTSNIIDLTWSPCQVKEETCSSSSRSSSSSSSSSINSNSNMTSTSSDSSSITPLEEAWNVLLDPFYARDSLAGFLLEELALAKNSTYLLKIDECDVDEIANKHLRKVGKIIFLDALGKAKLNR